MPPIRNAKPLGAIALSFSGGGGRAAGFHLGTLACLDRLNLLRDVSILSTVSGGSFVGASYVLALKEAPPGEDLHVTFGRYFNDFRKTLLDSKLLPWALQHLAEDRIHVPSGRHNLVTALAQVYHETFLHRAAFGILWDGKPIHLKEIIFNATEFRTGIAFRFQKSDYPCVIGNDRVCIAEEHARAMRLADVVASSSCIPVGLEPIMFPDDFAWPDSPPDRVAAIKADLKRQCGVDTVPIMDGGVYDNQGIESALLAVHRDPRHATAGDAPAAPSLAARFERLLASEHDLGTFIVSDTPLLSDEGFKADLPPPRRGRLTLRRLDLITRLLAAASLLTIGYLIGHLSLSRNQLNIWREVDDLFTYVIPITLSALLFGTLVAVRRKVREALDAFPQSGHSAWRDVRHLTLPQVAEMVKLRLGSTWALTSWVYFNRIRQLGYNLLLTIPGARHHVMPHEIDDLIQPGLRDHRALPEWLRPSPAAAALARRASTLPTQLWYDSEEDLDTAINCGRMTMCFNVLAHLEREYPIRTEAQQQLHDRAKADWTILQADPSAPLPPVTGAAR